MEHYNPFNIFLLDTRTLLSVLVWANILAAAMVYLFMSVNKSAYGKDHVRLLALTRVFEALGCYLLFTRGGLPDILSVNIGNTFIFISFYLEARLLLILSETSNGKLYLYLKYVLAASVITFNLFDFMFRSPALRITVASLNVFSLMVIPAVTLVFSKNTKHYKRLIGAIYVFFTLVQLPRAIDPLMRGNLTVLSNTYFQTLTFLTFILMMISSTIVYLFIMKESTDQIIRKMAVTDGLTNISNRYGFMEGANRFFEACKAQNKEVTLLFFDIDDFKQVNDTYGHAFGDGVLIRFAKALESSLRSCDLSCRYGGEEFLALLSSLPADEPELASAICERIMGEFKKVDFCDHPEFKVTVSAGIVSGVPKDGETLQTYIDRADEALYHAKNTGKNKLAVYNEL